MLYTHVARILYLNSITSARGGIIIGWTIYKISITGHSISKYIQTNTEGIAGEE
jgi:hypothetical protein